ncbi:hypothetical protein BKA83DRAFT_4122532 [Pisolithus microcarpus]|nr:hypothetical protein BKA83DRAFT_4122532 [Pisolithus microcarpus]
MSVQLPLTLLAAASSWAGLGTQMDDQSLLVQLHLLVLVWCKISSRWKATGGSAIRVSIGTIKGDGVGTNGDCAQTAPAETTCRSVVVDNTTQQHILNGGDLWSCDYCEHVVCSMCITVMKEDREDLSAPDVEFECSKIITPYWGFYHCGVPVLKVWLTINRPMELSVSHLVTKLHSITFKNVMVSLTDHSDNSCRDLFIGKTTGKEDQACVLSECLDILLSPFGDILHGGLFVLFVCGHHFSSTIAFDAEHLQVILTSNLILGVVECTFIEGYPVRMAMPEALGESSQLGYHSSIYLLMLACTNTALELTVTNCTNEDCGKLDGKGPKMFKFARLPGIKLLDLGKRWNSAWLEIRMGIQEFPLCVA